MAPLSRHSSIEGSPSVSILIPTYNGERFLSETLSSALEQTFSDIEVVVNDDGSDDRTQSIIQERMATDPRIRMTSSMRLGIGGSRNAAYGHSSASKYLLFLDHDDVLTPTAVADLLDCLECNPGSPACHGQVTLINNHGKAVRASAVNPADTGLLRRKLPGTGVRAALCRLAECQEGEPTSFGVLLAGCPITSVGQVLIRRSAFEQIGGFDPLSAPADDWDLYLALSQFGPLALCDKPVLAWRMHSGNTSNDRSLMVRAAHRVFRKLVHSHLSPAERTALKTQLLHNLAAYILNALRGDCTTGIRTHIVPALALLLDASMPRRAKRSLT